MQFAIPMKSLMKNNNQLNKNQFKSKTIKIRLIN